jgi:hypothetical protein
MYEENTKKFYVLNESIAKVAKSMYSDHLLILFDYKWYVKNEKEIIDWCDNHLSYFSQQGMGLHFASETELTMFLLRWS